MFKSLELILLALAGGIGTLIRFSVTKLAERCGVSFPLGTLIANVGGCLSMGIVVALASSLPNLRSDVRTAITVGLLGGLTTFSTFGLESFLFLTSGRQLTAIIHLLLHNVLGIGAIWLGYRMTQRLAGM